MLSRARKIKSLKELEEQAEVDANAIDTLRKRINSLKKLQIILKKKSTFAENKKMLIKISELCQLEASPVIKELQIPQHLLCLITGDFMKEPVMIESGMTYEKAMIEQCFHFQEQQYELDRQEEQAAYDAEKALSYIKCPATSMVVRKEVMIYNKRIKLATEDFMARNPWALDFDPRMTFRNIKIN